MSKITAAIALIGMPAAVFVATQPGDRIVCEGAGGKVQQIDRTRFFESHLRYRFKQAGYDQIYERPSSDRDAFNALAQRFCTHGQRPEPRIRISWPQRLP